MAEPLATVTQLAARLGRTLDTAETAMAAGALADASARVRFAGLPWPNPELAPAVVVGIVLDAAERRIRNPEGLRSETLGDYQYSRTSSTPTGTSLSGVETAIIRRAAGFGGLVSVPVASFGGEL